MPALRLAGHKWRVSSDFVPIFAVFGLIFHVAWIILIIVWPYGITKVHKCNDSKPGREFLGAVSLLFVLYVLSALQETLIIVIGLQGQWLQGFCLRYLPATLLQVYRAWHSGTPLETRKRKAMIPVLYTQTANWIGQLGAVGMQNQNAELHCVRARALLLLTHLQCTGYATYVEHDYSGQMATTDCRDDSVIMLKVLVYSSWVMMAFNW